jgi:hypothetical protein
MRSALWGCAVLAGCAGKSVDVIPHQTRVIAVETRAGPDEKHPVPTARFTALDAAFTSAPRQEPPVVVLDDKELAKAAQFRAVGVLQLTGKENNQMVTFYDTALEAGRVAGCDVLYQRDAFELGTRVERPKLPGADGGIGRFLASSGRDWRRSDQLVWQFLCGVTGGEQGDTVQRAARCRVERRRSNPRSMRPI